MPRTGHILDALRVAAQWLLVVSVFYGPAGLGGSAASGSMTCGVSCPCDEGAHADHRGGEGDHAEPAGADPCDDHGEAGLEHETDEPCQDECPADCPNCGCCPGVVMAVLPLPLTSGATSCISMSMLARVNVAPSGECTGVFRPPRSLT